MKKTSYQNRYGDVYDFTLQQDGTVLWEGPFDDYCRIGYDLDCSCITLIDPSGGPYISLGTPFRYLGDPKKITKLEWLKEDEKNVRVKIVLE